MIAVLRWTGIGKLVSFYRYIAFNSPRVVTGLGIVLVLGIGAIQLYLLTTSSGAPGYLSACRAVLSAAAALAALGMLTGQALGWALGSVTSAAASGLYLTSRTVGLPGLPQLVGWWDYPLGTFLLVLAALVLALHFSVRTGMNVAYPQRQDWHD
jgi:hypothetical protein